MRGNSWPIKHRGWTPRRPGGGLSADGQRWIAGHERPFARRIATLVFQAARPSCRANIDWLVLYEGDQPSVVDTGSAWITRLRNKPRTLARYLPIYLCAVLVAFRATMRPYAPTFSGAGGFKC